MRILIISDVHLGAPYFKNKDKLLYLLSSKSWNKIILNGDTYELLGNKSLETIQKENKELVEFFNRPNVARLSGNHDPNAQQEYILDLPNGKKVIVTHGHKYDKSLTSSFSVKLNIFFYNLLGFEIRRLLKPFRSYKKSVEMLVKEVKCDILVIGHSHDPYVNKINNIEVYNDGDWIEHSSYIEINDSEISLKKM